MDDIRSAVSVLDTVKDYCGKVLQSSADLKTSACCLAETMPEHIRALAHLSYTHSRKKKLATELAYFRSLRHRMRYAEAQAQNLPIGSGVVEAVFKTLATQRMKRSGMHWRPTGGKPF